jgi:Putative homoserine kinase type II (protein kinase fold)
MTGEHAGITKDVLQRWLRLYGPETVDDFTSITVGISNATFIVICASGRRYVIRKLGAQAIASARAEARIQQALIENGLSSPAYLPLSEGKFIGQDGEVAVTIARYVAGQHPDRLSLELAGSFGEVMGRIHDVLDLDRITVPYNPGQWLNRRNVSLEIARCGPTEGRRLQVMLERSLPLFDADLPAAIIHGELATNNVFTERDHAPRLLDLAYIYLSMVYDEQLDPAELLAALREGYDGVVRRPLTALELTQFTRAVEYAAVAASAWCYSRGMSDYGDRFLGAGTDPSVRAATG